MLVAPAVGRFAMPHVPADTLIVHGELDEVVPLADMLEWARPQHLPIVVVPEAEHYFHGRDLRNRDSVAREISAEPRALRERQSLQ